MQTSFKSLIFLTCIGITETIHTAQISDCIPCYGLGPENYGVNAPACPKTCNGDFTITIAGFYWNAREDGLEYAIDNAVTVPLINPNSSEIQELNNLIEANYKTPNFKWDFGFKLEVGYNTTCDGWDIEVCWTQYKNRAFSHIQTDVEDNHTLLTLWSAFYPAQGSNVYARDIEANWKLKLNLIDVELGRDFWTSKRLSIRPFIGFRHADIDQDFDLKHKGGSWTPRNDPVQDPFSNEVKLDNEYKGIGLRSGLDSLWHFGCGWALYGNFAASLIYGRFNIEHDEKNRLSVAPFLETEILKTNSYFRASRAILDLALAIQWSSLFCDCKYGITAMLGWEQHLFFHQNQLWRVNRLGNVSTGLPNNFGENVFNQCRGTLSTQGLTFTFKFEF